MLLPSLTAATVTQSCCELGVESPGCHYVVLCCCRLGDNQRAFDSLGASLLHDPRNPRTLLAAGSIIQVPQQQQQQQQQQQPLWLGSESRDATLISCAAKPLLF
jgi:hypothetical protein